jgi:AraC family transcriptional regulator
MSQQAFTGYREWYRNGPLAGVQVGRSFVPAVDAIIPAGPVSLFNSAPPAGEVVEPPVPEYALVLALRTAPLLRVGFNRTPRWIAVWPGSLLFTPPDTQCEFIGEASGHCLSVVVSKARVEEFVAETGARVDLREEESFSEPRLAHAIMQLWQELEDDAPALQLLADHVMRSVMESLARRTGTPPKVSQRIGRERLPNHTLRRLADFIEHSLADELDVTQMAGVACLSPAHFARAFAATVGMTPFRYVMTRRLARAREMLEQTRRSTIDIAYDVGFKTPSHFTSRFRQEFGVTPRAIRPDSRRSHVSLIAAPSNAL